MDKLVKGNSSLQSTKMEGLKKEERKKMVEDILKALAASDCALTLEEIKKRINYEPISDNAIMSSLAATEEIKHKNIGQLIKEFNMKRYGFGINPNTRIFYLKEEQVEASARKSRYYK